MNIAIVGGGINGICTAYVLSQNNHSVTVFERETVMSQTSRSSSKLLHGGLRYLENLEFRLVKEALNERDYWVSKYHKLTKPIRLTIPVYKNSRRSRLTYGIGLKIYDLLAGEQSLVKSSYTSRKRVLIDHSNLQSDGLIGAFDFSDAQMDDEMLGKYVAAEAQRNGVKILEHVQVDRVKVDGQLVISDKTHRFDKIINIAGPWSETLLKRSDIQSPFSLDLVRGSHLVLSEPISRSYLLEIPGDRRIFFVLPWKGKAMIGTTEVRQNIDDPIKCSYDERENLISAFTHYFLNIPTYVESDFSGLRPLIKSNENPNKATREYALYDNNKLLTVYGGKWTTAIALARKISQRIH